MKATQTVLKSVAAMTAMGIILAGCSGGSTATRQTSNTTPTTTVPTITVPSTVDTTTNTVGATATDDIAANTAAVNALKADLAQTLAASQAAASNSQSANNKNSWILGLAIAGVGLLALERVSTAVDTGNTVGPDGKKLGFGAGLGAGIFNSKTKMAQANAARAHDDARATSDHVIKQAELTRGNTDANASDVKENTNVNADQTNRLVAGGIRVSAANLAESKKVNGAVGEVANTQAQQGETINAMKAALDTKLVDLDKAQKASAALIVALQESSASKDALAATKAALEQSLNDSIASQTQKIAELKVNADQVPGLVQKLDAAQATLDAQKAERANLLAKANPSNSSGPQGSANFVNPDASVAAVPQVPVAPEGESVDQLYPSGD
ncbi:MAG: hypothetical protein J0L93_04115 [Deltaproteobacteria bacterium]|nr:hypothetical protein [Deltaproteobacteria bacterium]